MSYKIVIIGAGSAQFGKVAIGDILSKPELAGSEIVLVDINVDALAIQLGAAQGFIDENRLDFTVSADPDRTTALVGADFVIISIEVGERFPLWEIDWNLPQQYGSKQVYGENGGVGGLLHALRITPPILDICEDVMTICPEAWVFNYSNPMSRICTTVTRRFPNLRLIGMCHEIASIKRHVPRMLKRDYDSMILRAGGLNHFSVLVEARDRNSGEDIYPEILKKAPDYFKTIPGYSDIYHEYKHTGRIIETETALTYDDDGEKRVSSREWSDRGVFKRILETLDLLPITTDSHFGEYIHWAAEIADHRGIIDFFDYYRLVLFRQAYSLESVEKERFASVIVGLVGGGDYEEAAVNIPNRKLIQNLPEWLVVETPAKVKKDRIRGIQLDVPVQFKALLSNQIGIHDLTAEAVLRRSKKVALQAIMADPAIGTVRLASDLLELAIEKQSPHLDYLT